MITRVITNSGSSNGTVHTIQDARGNIVAEADGTGQTLREYIWLPDAGYSGTDLSIAVVTDVDTTPVVYYAHTDHLGRPVKLTNASKSSVWDAVWLPFGGAHAITGSLTHDHRLPGQWYQLEAGLHYNWHRHYDPSIGRYTQPDPLGFVDGPSQYAYARSNPQMFVDPDGRAALCFAGPMPCAAAIAVQAARMCLAIAAASTMHSSSRPDACGGNNSCMADEDGAEEPGNDPEEAEERPRGRKKYQRPTNPNRRKGAEGRQQSGERERNVGHPKGEEHTIKPKGPRGSNRNR